MLLFGSEDLLLKPTVTLYNNVAQVADCHGRLRAELQVHPSPRIKWEFELLGDAVVQSEDWETTLKNPIRGAGFAIDEPRTTGYSRGFLGAERLEHRGVAAEARYGILDEGASWFSFFLPNTRFLTYWRGQKEESGRSYTRASLDEGCGVQLVTDYDTQSWLRERESNTGVMLTTWGQLYAIDQESAGEQAPQACVGLAWEEALRHLEILGVLLSFANGGYLQALYVEGTKGDRVLGFAGSLVRVYRVTPVELLGDTWFAHGSDLVAFLHCYPTLRRMLTNCPWNKVFRLIRTWYFQAIQPQGLHVHGKHLDVVAVAVATALERLSHTILVEEGMGSRRGGRRQRVTNLLQLIGISKARGYDDADDIEDFFNVRNDATHPKRRLGISFTERERLVLQAIQWIEEILLWRLGYDGKYSTLVPTLRGKAIEPRYDVSTRDTKW